MQNPTPNPVGQRDIEVLSGWALVLERAILAATMPLEMRGRLRRRLVEAKLLAPGAGERELRRAISDLRDRLRYSLGEDPEPPTPARHAH